MSTDITLQDASARLHALMAENGIKIAVTFVPWSQSRNAKPKPKLDDRSLNWRVVVTCKGYHVVSTDYHCGIGHCPSYSPSARPTLDYAEKIALETETGKHATSKKAILPDVVSIFSCLLMDAEVLDYASFEQWVEAYGGNPDSRKEEKVYRQCLETALALRAGLGEALLSKASEIGREV